MSQSLVSTKNRQPFLTDADFRIRVHAYWAGTMTNLDSPALLVGGVADHVHLLCRLSKTHSIADVVRDLKRSSSN